MEIFIVYCLIAYFLAGCWFMSALGRKVMEINHAVILTLFAPIVLPIVVYAFILSWKENGFLWSDIFGIFKKK